LIHVEAIHQSPLLEPEESPKTPTDSWRSDRLGSTMLQPPSRHRLTKSNRRSDRNNRLAVKKQPLGCRSSRGVGGSYDLINELILVRSAVASTTTGDAGEAEEGEDARGGDDREASLLAAGAKTLIPSDFERRTLDTEFTVVGETTDEHAEADDSFANLTVEARGASVVPTSEIAGVGGGVTTKVRVETRTGTSTH
jgi:hypothetical protein